MNKFENQKLTGNEMKNANGGLNFRDTISWYQGYETLSTLIDIDSDGDWDYRIRYIYGNGYMGNYQQWTPIGGEFVNIAY